MFTLRPVSFGVRQAPLRIAILLFAGLSALVTGQPARADKVIAAKKSKVFHTLPEECSAAQKINPSNIVEYGSAADAEREGRRLCKICARMADQKKKAPPRNSQQNPPKKKSEGGGVKKVSLKEAEDVLPESSPQRSVRVKKVWVGGTMQLDKGERVVLMGIICPLEGQAFADEAVSLLQKRTRGRNVKIASPQGLDGLPQRDRLGRLCVVMESDGKDVAAELLGEGLAWFDHALPPNTSERYYKQLDDAAWAERGIWKRLDGSAGSAAVVAGKYTHEYHPPDCPHVEHLTDPATITLNEAKGRRLAPCDHVREKAETK